MSAILITNISFENLHIRNKADSMDLLCQNVVINLHAKRDTIKMLNVCIVVSAICVSINVPNNSLEFQLVTSV